MNDIMFDMCQKLQKHFWNAYSFMHNIVETIFVWSVGEFEYAIITPLSIIHIIIIEKPVYMTF